MIQRKQCHEKIIILLLFLLTNTLTCLSYAQVVDFKPQNQSDADVQKLINFLTSTDGGISYMGKARELKGKVLPLSYYSTKKYWADYVCYSYPAGTCNVTDKYNDCEYTVSALAGRLHEGSDVIRA